MTDVGRIGVFGASGSGKSAWVKQQIQGRGRVVVFDPMQEYQALGFKTVRKVDQVRLAMRDDWAGFRVAFVPAPGLERRDLSQLCNLLAKSQEHILNGGKGVPMTLVAEELNLASSANGSCPGFADLCSRGRHYQIALIGVSQRIAEVSTRFRGNTTEAVILRQRGSNDIKAASELLGIPRSEIEALGNLEYLHERRGEVTRGRLKFS